MLHTKQEESIIEESNNIFVMRRRILTVKKIEHKKNSFCQLLNLKSRGSSSPKFNQFDISS